MNLIQNQMTSLYHNFDDMCRSPPDTTSINKPLKTHPLGPTQTESLEPIPFLFLLFCSSHFIMHARTMSMFTDSSIVSIWNRPNPGFGDSFGCVSSCRFSPVIQHPLHSPMLLSVWSSS